MRAIEAGDVSEVQRLLRAGADTNFERQHEAEKTLTQNCRPSHPCKVLARFPLSEGEFVAHLGEAERKLYSTLPLHAAIWRGKHEIAIALVKAGADVNRRLENGHTALHVAVLQATFNNAEKDRALIRLLLTHGADINNVDSEGTPLLHAAAGQYSIPLVRLLLEAGANIDAQDLKGETLLHKSIGLGEKLAELLLSQKPDVNIVSKRGWTPLFHALSANKLALASRLVEMGAKFNVRDAVGKTALRFAVDSHHPAAVKLALDLGIDPNVQANDGTTALHGAVLKMDCLALLLEHGANPSLADKQGRTPLDVVLAMLGDAETRYCQNCYAAAKLLGQHMKPPKSFRFARLIPAKSRHAKRYRELGRKLARKGEKVGLDQQLWSAAGGQLERVELLLAHGGADLDLKHQRGETPLYRAVSTQAWMTAKALLEAGADPNGSGGLPPLFVAAEYGYFACAGLLLAHGADATLMWQGRNPTGYAWKGASPLVLAERRGDRAMVKLLTAYGARPM